MRSAVWIAAGLALAVLGVAAWIRLAPDDPAVWHVDPLTAPSTGRPNAFRVGPDGLGAVPPDAPAPVWPMPAGALAAAFDAHALAQPRTVRLAGGPDELWATYIQRSRVWGFPDYVSVRFVELDAGRSSLAVYSRARYGDSDLGVNRARVQAWLAALPPVE